MHYRNIGANTDTILYTEADPKFDVEVSKKDGQIYCTVQSKTENEIYLIPSGLKNPELKLICKRKPGTLVTVKADETLYLLKNDENNNCTIEQLDFDNPDVLLSNIKIDPDDYIIDILPLKDAIVANTYTNSIPKLKYFDKVDRLWQEIDFDFGLGDYNLISAEEDTNIFVFSFSSPAHPFTKYRYEIEKSKLKKLTTDGLVHPRYYKNVSTKRLWAKSYDGVQIPITLIQNPKKNVGLILKAYGAYGAITTPSFDARDAILLEQGYSIAYAHVRGESILGLSWYKSGRELLKENSILDYLSCAEYVIKQKLTTADNLVGYGQSAGGLIIGQPINLKPELFKTVILDHPYLDVVNTMMNDTLPLTIDEYKEWGNPTNLDTYNYLLNYSPYQNISPQKYPNVLLVASYKDYRTPIWQISKYLVNLRENNLSDTNILLLTDMNSGHIGSTTEKEWIKLFSQISSFLNLSN